MSLAAVPSLAGLFNMVARTGSEAHRMSFVAGSLFEQR